ncbi:transposase [Beggiatoa leptomitoformis]|uniref:transposase n=1 Tax=Beggiatoa leptomitoformis TaxID=288004 RepID=UPI000B13EC78
MIDNATSHKRSDIHTAELPPYSPDLNPIEHKWAQVKALRKRQHCSIDVLFS